MGKCIVVSRHPSEAYPELGMLAKQLHEIRIGKNAQRDACEAACRVLVAPFFQVTLKAQEISGQNNAQDLSLAIVKIFIEKVINQEPDISRQISLWNRRGSKVVQGHLLIIPIEESLLYVEPLYLEAEKNSLPTLARVIVVYKNQIIMATSLDKALDSIFTNQEQANKEDLPIIRSLDNTIIPGLEADTITTEQ